MVIIEKVEVFCLQDPHFTNARCDGSFQNVVVVVTADNGFYGVSESDSPPKLIKTLIEMPDYSGYSMGLAQIIIGQELDHPQRIWQLMFDKTILHGRVGALIHAISAIDMALWDLFSKVQHKPLYQLLGSLKHSRLPCYATIYNLSSNPSTIKQAFQPYIDNGFKRFKICVEPWWNDTKKIIKYLEELRHCLGPDYHLMLDVALEFSTIAQLQPFLPVLEKLDFKWLEAPFPLDDIKSYSLLKQMTTLPIGIGDTGLTTCSEYEVFLSKNNFDIAQPDISFFGGVSEVLKLIDKLKKQQKRIIFHAYKTDVLIAFNAHISCVQEQLEPLEISTSPSLLRRQLVKNPLRMDSDGMINLKAIEEYHGIGVEIDWNFMQKVTVS